MVKVIKYTIVSWNDKPESSMNTIGRRYADLNAYSGSYVRRLMLRSVLVYAGNTGISKQVAKCL